MNITLTAEEFNTLRSSSRADILSLLRPTEPTEQPSTQTEGFDFEDVVDLTPDQVSEFMQGCQPQTVAGLKVIAEHGPMIAANLLQMAGIENYGHFQGRVTKRTRTITGDRHVFLFALDDWSEGENAEREYGHYAVSETTFRSLRIFFGLD